VENIFLNELNFTYWMWFVAMLVLLGLEMFAPGIVFLWLGIAAGIVGAYVYFDPLMTWESQLVLFAVLSIFSVLGGRHFVKTRGIETEDNNLNRRGEALIGRTVMVAIEMKNGSGKVKVGDTLWSAEGPDMPEGTEAKVDAVRGIVLVISPA